MANKLFWKFYHFSIGIQIDPETRTYQWVVISLIHTTEKVKFNDKISTVIRGEGDPPIVSCFTCFTLRMHSTGHGSVQ